MSSLTSVLVVDDEPAMCELMSHWAASLGLASSTACNADEALRLLDVRHHDLAVIDVMMPGRNGLWLAGELRRDYPHVAVVLATGHRDLLPHAAQSPSVADFLVKPFPRDRFLQAMDRGRQWRRQAFDDIQTHAHLSVQLQDRIVQVCSLIASEHARGVDEAKLLRAIAGRRTPEVAQHSERVARHTIALARAFDVAEARLRAIEQAAIFHDIGKIAIPDSILAKPRGLSAVEMAIMRRHVDAGQILESTRTLQTLAPVVWATHEWCGGGGYPRRLAGAAIPTASRLIAVADAYDSMTENRPYRPSVDRSEALAELQRAAPAQFDPRVVATFVAMGDHLRS